jgi:hypothetical protein
MFIRETFILALLVIGCAGRAYAANSCANLDVLGTYDQSGLEMSEYGISAVGTFRIQNEPDENRQPDFNLARLHCEKQTDAYGKPELQCKIMQATVIARDEKPNTDNPNCSLDLDDSEYSMKQLQKGVLVGASDVTSCYNTMLTVDTNTKRVYLSFTRTKYADNYDKTQPGTCGSLPRTEVLMNCSAYPRMRKPGAPPRYCDFSNSSDK